jgi:hypothetical protein
MSSRNHFTATIEVLEVVFIEKDNGYQKPKTQEREVRDVTRLTLRADSLEKLQAKVTAHVALIEN